MKNTDKKHTVVRSSTQGQRKAAARGLRESSFGGIKKDSSIGVVFTGPSVEGTDKEFIKVYSGKVIDKKPSFA